MRGPRPGAAEHCSAVGQCTGPPKALDAPCSTRATGLIVIAATDLEAHFEGAITRATKIEKKQLQADEEALEAEIDDAAKT